MSSLEQRTTRSGTVWRVRYRRGHKNHAVTFTTQKGAADWQRLLDSAGPAIALAALDAPETDAGTVAEVVARHIEHLTGVTEGTRKTYRAVVAGDMALIGALPVTALDREAVSRWVNALEARGLAGKSIANRHGLLSAAMQGAVMDGLVPANPCRGIRLPRSDGHEMMFLSREDFARLHALLPEHWRPLALLLVGTGLRLGEATALQGRHVDVEHHTVRVVQAWKHTGSSAVRELGPPKTRRGRRTVPAPGPVLDAIGSAGPDAFVFTTTRGDPVMQSTVWKVWRRAAREFAGDGQVPRIHDLRHTYASWAIQSGISLPVIQRALGHESITTTVDRYGHLARADFDALADATAVNLPPPRQLGS